jgi:O-antigen/teichoic acid export membrane protein
MNAEPPEQFDLKKHKVGSGLSWLVVGRLAMLFFSFFSTAIAARLLTPADFGLVATSNIVLALTNAIFDGAFGAPLVQRKDLQLSEISATFRFAMLISSASILIITLLSGSIQQFFGFPSLALVLIVSASSLWLRGLGTVSRSLLQRRGQFKQLATISFAASLVGYCGLTILLAWLGLGVWSLVLGMIVAEGLDAVLSAFYARIWKAIKAKPNAIRGVARQNRGFLVNQTINWAANVAPNAVAGRMLGLDALGIFSRGWKFLDLAVAVTAGPMQRVLFPTFSRLQDSPGAARELLLQGLNLSVLLFSILSLLIFLHADALVLLALGPKWEGAVPVTQALFCALVARCSFKISESVALGFGRTRAAALRQCLYAAMMIVSGLIGSAWGGVGVAIGIAIAMWLFYLVSLQYAAALLKALPTSILAAHARPLLILVPMCLADIAVQMAAASWPFWVMQFLSGGVSVAVGTVLLWKLPAGMAGRHIVKLRAAGLERVQRRSAP